jgi:hypothetical protein
VCARAQRDPVPGVRAGRAARLLLGQVPAGHALDGGQLVGPGQTYFMNNDGIQPPVGLNMFCSSCRQCYAGAIGLAGHAGHDDCHVCRQLDSLAPHHSHLPSDEFQVLPACTGESTGRLVSVATVHKTATTIFKRARGGGVSCSPVGGRGVLGCHPRHSSASSWAARTLARRPLVRPRPPPRPPPQPRVQQPSWRSS